MIVDADAVEARHFATDNERGKFGQWPTDRNAKGDTEPGHGTSTFRSAPPSYDYATISASVGQRQQGCCDADRRA
jgi:hypothetical protein